MNIVLIGMPGSGKTTLARELRRIIGYKVIDSDRYIRRMSGMSVDEMFEIGEDYFRGEETVALKEIMARYNNTVVSCGGGVVERDENKDIIRNNGFVIFINRDIEEIKSIVNVKSRPLLKDDKNKMLDLLYEKRIEKYRDFCHIEVGMKETLFLTARYIKEELRRRRII